MNLTGPFACLLVGVVVGAAGWRSLGKAAISERLEAPKMSPTKQLSVLSGPYQTVQLSAFSKFILIHLAILLQLGFGIASVQYLCSVTAS